MMTMNLQSISNVNSEFRRAPESLIFQPFANSNDDTRYIANQPYLDPDSNFYNEHPLPVCEYTTAYELSNIVQTKLGDSNFSMIHVNCRGLYTNFQNLNALLDSFSFHIPVIALTETWTTADNENNYNIAGYVLQAKSRSHKTGGGVGFYISNSIAYKLREDLILDLPDIFESIFIELVSLNVIVGCVYRAPNSDLALFNARFDTLLSKINCSKQLCYIAGDFNINLLKYEQHEGTANYVNCIFSHSFFPCINRPTRITTSTATLIDNIITNACFEQTINPAIVYSDVSDHLPIFIHVKLLCVKQLQPNYPLKRNMSESNKSIFLQRLIDIDWNQYINNNNDVNIQYNAFLEKYSSIFNESFPLIKVSSANKRLPRKPWMTVGLVKSCKKRKNYIKNSLTTQLSLTVQNIDLTETN